MANQVITMSANDLMAKLRKVGVLQHDLGFDDQDLSRFNQSNEQELDATIQQLEVMVKKRNEWMKSLGTELAKGGTVAANGNIVTYTKSSPVTPSDPSTRSNEKLELLKREPEPGGAREWNPESLLSPVNRANEAYHLEDPQCEVVRLHVARDPLRMNGFWGEPKPAWQRAGRLV